MTGYRAGRQGVETGNAPGSIQAALDGEETADILFELLANVVHRQHPEVAAVLRGKSEPGEFALELLARAYRDEAAPPNRTCRTGHIRQFHRRGGKPGCRCARPA